MEHRKVFIGAIIGSSGILLSALTINTLYPRQLPATPSFRSQDYRPFRLRNTTNSLTIQVNGQVVVIPSEVITTWYETYRRSYTDTVERRVKNEPIIDYLRSLSYTTTIRPINAKLDYKNGIITEFIPPQPGQELNITESYAAISDALVNGASQAVLVIHSIEPDITLQKIDNMGITALLARGESDFKGSSSSRIHNIKTAARLFDGILVAPGEEFSFNKVLGIVDGTTGYKPELVIKNKGVVKEYGGGVCQVSTTLFRAAILAGLPIIERHPHTLSVRYYNPQGFDATVYPGIVDLRFTNDTGSNILIQPQINGTKISFGIYGSQDGRIVSMTTPQQYSSGPDGGPRYVFTRTVTATDGVTHKEPFYSLYRAPLPTPLPGQPVATPIAEAIAHNPLE